MAAGHAVLHFAAQQIGVADELRGIGGCRPVVNFARRRHLLQLAHAQQSDAVRHDHGFFLIMSDKHERDSDLALQRLQFHLHLAAKIGVQRRKRLVEQQQSRPIYQRAGQSDALLLSAADFRRLGPGVWRHLHHVQCLLHSGRNFLLRQPARSSIRSRRSPPR